MGAPDPNVYTGKRERDLNINVSVQVTRGRKSFSACITRDKSALVIILISYLDSSENFPSK